MDILLKGKIGKEADFRGSASVRSEATEET